MIYILQPVSGLGEGYAKLFKVAGRDAIVISLAHKTMQEIEMLETGRDDIFIITDAHLPVINQLTHKQGRIFGIVRQAVRFTFNPCLYHGLFVETHWAKKRLIQLHPDIAIHLHVATSPFDACDLQPFCKGDKVDNLVVFTQAFTQENLHILEVYLADLLIQAGYRTIHLFPMEAYSKSPLTVDARELIREGEKRGMVFISCDTKEEYWRRFAEATLMITTALSGNAAPLLQATVLGVSPLAPCFGDFPELLPVENLYRPFNLNHILQLASSPPGVPDIAERFLPKNCWQPFLTVLDDE